MQQLLEALWYGERHKVWPLLPLSWMFQAVAAIRRNLYRCGVLQVQHLPVPVVVVGNLSVGGTGKTPLLIHLAQLLRAHGKHPGIVSRGYGGHAKHWPLRVDNNSDPALVGDEPVLLATETGCPVAVGPERAAAARLLLEHSACDLILSDDGLQHYALDRTLEIAVIDGARRFGNGFCLPAGPLREPLNRLCDVDMLICNGTASETNEYSMQVCGDTAVHLLTGEVQPLSFFAGQACHAVAAIGNPQRFFALLRKAGIGCREHVFPDHHPFRAADLAFNGGEPVLMTGKDAVKCRRFGCGNFWSVPVRAVPEAAFDARFLQLLREKTHG